MHHQYSVTMVVTAKRGTPFPAASRTTGIQGWNRNVILTVTGQWHGWGGFRVGSLGMTGLYQMYPVFEGMVVEAVSGVGQALFEVDRWVTHGSTCREKPPPSLLCTPLSSVPLLGRGKSYGTIARAPSRAASEMLL